MSNTNEINWSDAIWQEINDAVVQEVHKVRIAQKVIPTMMLEGDPTEIQDEEVDIDHLTIAEGKTKPFVEIYLEFTLTSAQVSKEAQLKTAKTLARMAAKQIALAEDKIIFQGRLANLGDVETEHLDSTGNGLLGKAADPIEVFEPLGKRADVLYGENVFGKVAEGIARLTENAQAPGFALFLPTKIYADTFTPPSNQSLVTTAERIKPLVEGGFYGTGTLPEDRALLIALGGEPTTIYVGREAQAEYVRKEGSRYIFRVVERIQFVTRDSRAYVRFDFQAGAAAAGLAGFRKEEMKMDEHQEMEENKENAWK